MKPRPPLPGDLPSVAPSSSSSSVLSFLFSACPRRPLRPMKGHDGDALAMEITVLSAEDLKNPSSSLAPGSRLRPFVALFATSSPDCDRLPPPLHCTRVDERGAYNPSWGDKIRLPLDPATFLLGDGGGGGGEEGDDAAGVCLAVLSKRWLGRPSRLGWCRIPPSDVLDGLRPPSALRRLSYGLRSPRHGCRGHGVVHLAVRLLGRDLDRVLAPPRPLREEPGWRRVAIGIPVAAFRPPGWASGGVDCVQMGRFDEGRGGFDVGGFDIALNY